MNKGQKRYFNIERPNIVYNNLESIPNQTKQETDLQEYTNNLVLKLIKMKQKDMRFQRTVSEKT